MQPRPKATRAKGRLEGNRKRLDGNGGVPKQTNKMFWCPERPLAHGHSALCAGRNPRILTCGHSLTALSRTRERLHTLGNRQTWRRESDGPHTALGTDELGQAPSKTVACAKVRALTGSGLLLLTGGGEGRGDWGLGLPVTGRNSAQDGDLQ